MSQFYKLWERDRIWLILQRDCACVCVSVSMTRSAEAIAKRAAARGLTTNEQRQNDWQTVQAQENIEQEKSRDVNPTVASKTGDASSSFESASRRSTSTQPRGYSNIQGEGQGQIPRNAHGGSNHHKQQEEVEAPGAYPHINTENRSRICQTQRVGEKGGRGIRGWACKPCSNVNLFYREDCFRCRRPRQLAFWGIDKQNAASASAVSRAGAVVAPARQSALINIAAPPGSRAALDAAAAVSDAATDPAATDTPQWGQQAGTATLERNAHLRDLARICAYDGVKSESVVQEWLALSTDEQERGLLLVARSERKAAANAEANYAKAKAKAGRAKTAAAVALHQHNKKRKAAAAAPLTALADGPRLAPVPPASRGVAVAV